jgi:hypothetical protein
MPMAGSWAVIAKASLVIAVFFGLTAPSRAQETSNLAFVSEYIRELGKVERLRSLAMNELKDESNRMASCIRSSTRFQLELRSQISMLRGMRLNPPFETLPGNIASFYERKIELYKRFADGCAAMMSGPKPGIDYAAIAAESPKLTAEMEYIDTALFDASPLVFATLIDPVPDANDHMSKLIITKERPSLSEYSEAVRLLILALQDRGWFLCRSSPNTRPEENKWPAGHTRNIPAALRSAVRL